MVVMDVVVSMLEMVAVVVVIVISTFLLIEALDVLPNTLLKHHAWA